jgi:hypothetical protein
MDIIAVRAIQRQTSHEDEKQGNPWEQLEQNFRFMWFGFRRPEFPVATQKKVTLIILLIAKCPKVQKNECVARDRVRSNVFNLNCPFNSGNLCSYGQPRETCVHQGKEPLASPFLQTQSQAWLLLADISANPPPSKSKGALRSC